MSAAITCVFPFSSYAEAQAPRVDSVACAASMILLDADEQCRLLALYLLEERLQILREMSRIGSSK